MPYRPITSQATEKGEVYVLHATTPYLAQCHEGSPHPVQKMLHYTGFASYAHGGADQRIKAHREGRGSRVTQVWKQHGISFEIAMVLPNSTRTDERRLKNLGSAKRFCPICQNGGEVASSRPTNGSGG